MPMNLRQQIRSTPLIHDPYLFAFRHDYWKRRQTMRKFYSFIRPGDLVFDIGANVGTHTREFLRLGARVVAVEPVPENARILNDIWHDNLCVVEAAVGADNTVATMHVGDVTDFSTLSDEWKARAEGERLRATWNREISVKVTTLDNLIHWYGKPKFIKIDVEGYERQVFDGLTKLPCLASFEYNSEFLEATWECLEKPCLRGCEFNFALEHEIKLSHWANARRLKEELYGVAGDVLVRPKLGD